MIKLPIEPIRSVDYIGEWHVVESRTSLSHVNRVHTSLGWKKMLPDSVLFLRRVCCCSTRARSNSSHLRHENAGVAQVSDIYPRNYIAALLTVLLNPTRSSSQMARWVTCHATAASQQPASRSKIHEACQARRSVRKKVPPCLHINLAFAMHNPCFQKPALWRQNRQTRRIDDTTMARELLFFSFSLRIFEGNTDDGRYRFPI